MATQSDIFDFRKRIDDPSGVIYFEEVDTLPSEYLPQTAYLYSVNGRYYSETGITRTRISDTEISGWLDNNTLEVCLIYAYKTIIYRIGAELTISKTDDGTESTTFTSLKEMLEYYKELLSQAKQDAGEDSSPMYLTSKVNQVGI